MALEVLYNKKYDILDQIVEEIHTKCIKMDQEETQTLVRRFKTVIDRFVQKMKQCDPFFSQIFNRIEYTGSFYEGLRVGEATEFDLNLILKPKLKIKQKRSSPGFISVIVEEKYETLPKHYKSWSTSNGAHTLLDPIFVSSWLQGLVQRTLDQIEDDLFDDCKIIVIRKSGPAWTLVIVSYEEPMKTIDVDLVPVLEFPCSEWPVFQTKCGNETWFAVPKPPRKLNNHFEWRLSFPKQENNMIKGLEFFKYTLRLLKRLRDRFGFKAIASYYIKTLFLWEVKNRDRRIWARNRRGRLFIYMLIRLRDALHTREIPFFWDPECNLIGHIGQDCLTNFHRRLMKFLEKIDQKIDGQNFEQLQKLMRDSLSSPEQMMAEHQVARDPSCTIL